MSTEPLSPGAEAPPEVDKRLVLSVREAAQLLGISKDLAYELVRRGEIPSLQLGRRLVVPRKKLLELVEQ